MDTMDMEDKPVPEPLAHTKKGAGIGPIIGIIIILILIALGGLYYVTKGIKNVDYGNTTQY